MKKKLLGLILLFALGVGAFYTTAQSGRFSWIVVGGREAATVLGVYGVHNLTVDFAGVATITCQDDGTTFTVAGAAVGDVVVVSPRATLADSGLMSCRVSTPDTITCEICNPTAGADDPASIELDVLVLRGAAHR
jgi:hypothetical protein